MMKVWCYCFILGLAVASVQNVNAQIALPGKYNSNAFLKDIHWKSKKEKGIQKYIPNLTQATQGLNAVVFLGTWCSDSEKWVPRFMDLEKRVGLNSVTYILVDKDKSDPDGLSQIMSITHVPTFIWMQNGVEVARIVESPANPYLYLDVLHILQNLD